MTARNHSQTVSIKLCGAKGDLIYVSACWSCFLPFWGFSWLWSLKLIKIRRLDKVRLRHCCIGSRHISKACCWAITTLLECVDMRSSPRQWSTLHEGITRINHIKVNDRWVWLSFWGSNFLTSCHWLTSFKRPHGSTKCTGVLLHALGNLFVDGRHGSHWSAGLSWFLHFWQSSIDTLARLY